MNIKNVIKESIKLYLFESLKTQRQKYGNELVDELKDLDPSNSYKYIDQICKFYKDGIDKNEIKTYIKLYDEKLNKNLIPIEYRDINKIKDFNELKDIVNNVQKQKSNREIKNEIFNQQDLDKQRYERFETNKGRWIVYAPYNTIQSIILGKGTKWCISQTTSTNYFNTYFINNRVVFYIIINQNDQKEKYQIQIYPDNKGREIYNQEDKMISFDTFENKTGIDPHDYVWYDQFEEINPLIVYDKKGNIIGKYIDGKKEGKWIEYYLNGNKKIEQTYKNNELNGEYIEYDENGNIIEKKNYKNGYLDGEYIEYYPNGNMKIKQNYKDNVLDGEYVEYNKNGNKTEEKHYKNGYLHGKHILYYDNGEKAIEVNYISGKKDDKYIYYNKSGKLIR